MPRATGKRFTTGGPIDQICSFKGDGVFQTYIRCDSFLLGGGGGWGLTFYQARRKLVILEKWCKNSCWKIRLREVGTCRFFAFKCYCSSLIKCLIFFYTIRYHLAKTFARLATFSWVEIREFSLSIAHSLDTRSSMSCMKIFQYHSPDSPSAHRVSIPGFG